MIVSISNAHEVSRSAGHWKRIRRVANGASIAKRATPETGASGDLSGGREVSVRRSSIVHKVAAHATLPDRAGQASVNTAWAPCRRDAAMQRALRSATERVAEVVVDRVQVLRCLVDRSH